MADILDSNGLTLDDYNTILLNLQSGMNEIFAKDGDTINFDSETEDGQLTNILAQLGDDIRALANNIYNSFNPDNCNGTVQDSRYALNYIARKGGRFTLQNIDITCDRTVNLQGLDDNYNDVNATSYTLADNAGNLWYLITSEELTAGTHTLAFRSQNYGSFPTTAGTIINQITKVLGVTNVNNSTTATTLGEDEETDEEFRIRRNRSTAIKGQSNYDAMLAQLLQLPDVADANIHINNTSSQDDTGTPAYTFWVIVDGGDEEGIASVIYQNSSGIPTRSDLVTGKKHVDVTSLSQQTLPITYYAAIPVNLYIQFDLKIFANDFNVNTDLIKQYIRENLKYRIGQTAETSYITEIAADALNAYGGGAYALNVEISTDGTTWTDYIESSSLQNKFVIYSIEINTYND